MRLYSEGKKKIDRDLNVIHVIRNLNFLKIFMRNNLMNEKIKWQVAHCEKNTINLDSGESDTSYEETDEEEE